MREGSRIAILSLGARLAEALKAADELAARGLSTTVADARFAKPLDRELILKLAATHKLLITVEEGAAGGFGAHVLTLLSEAGALENGLKVRTMTLPDKFQDHDKPDRMYAAAGLDAKGIVAKAIAALGDVERTRLEPLRVSQSSPARRRGAAAQAAAAISFALIAVVVLVALGYWAFNYIDQQRKLQNCLDSGRHDCEQRVYGGK